MNRILTAECAFLIFILINVSYLPCSAHQGNTTFYILILVIDFSYGLISPTLVALVEVEVATLVEVEAAVEEATLVEVATLEAMAVVAMEEVCPCPFFLLVQHDDRPSRPRILWRIR